MPGARWRGMRNEGAREEDLRRASSPRSFLPYRINLFRGARRGGCTCSPTFTLPGKTLWVVQDALTPPPLVGRSTTSRTRSILPGGCDRRPINRHHGMMSDPGGPKPEGEAPGTELHPRGIRSRCHASATCAPPIEGASYQPNLHTTARRPPSSRAPANPLSGLPAGGCKHRATGRHTNVRDTDVHSGLREACRSDPVEACGEVGRLRARGR